jgi:O-6-methylguanine DNA methyltransferase
MPMSDAVDDLLRAHFAPVTPPPDLARRALARLREERAAIERLLGGLAVDASPQGVTSVRPGAQAVPADRGARRHVEQARDELAAYLAGGRSWFDVAVDLSAVAPFQRRVLAAANAIPFGETRPYAWVAERTGAPNAVRAVGTALGRNPVPLIVPCHRVLRSDGGLGGYSLGAGPPLKAALLALERRTPALEGCTTTRIVCRVGCRDLARVRPDRRVTFASVADAAEVGYRPCRTCRPSDA